MTLYYVLFYRLSRFPRPFFCVYTESLGRDEIEKRKTHTHIRTQTGTPLSERSKLVPSIKR